jgi:SAM-dependent methyltransferase
MRVVGVALDEVISGSAADKGIEMVTGDFAQAKEKLAGERFDALLLCNVLHLVPEPAKVLKTFGDLLTKDAAVVVLSPNLKSAAIRWRRFRDDPRFEGIDGYESSGIHMSSHGEMRKWLRSAGMKADKFIDILYPHREALSRYTLGTIDNYLGSEFIAVARKV